MTAMRILLVEDDLPLARALHQSLRTEGFTANHVADAKSALLTIDTNECDMLILDLGLPDMDGLTLLKQIRKKNVALPVLILTARDSIEDKILVCLTKTYGRNVATTFLQQSHLFYPLFL